MNVQTFQGPATCIRPSDEEIAKEREAQLQECRHFIFRMGQLAARTHARTWFGSQEDDAYRAAA
jgi:hypothetical protein